MEHAHAQHNMLKDFSTSQQQLLDHLRLLQSGMAWWPKLCWMLYRSDRRNRKIVAKVRQEMNACDGTCQDGNCLAELYDQVAAMRDINVVIEEFSAELDIPGFIRNRLAETTDEWDELAEDCLVGSDPDIRATLNAIAARL